MSYDQTNIFAKILRGDVPTPKILDNDHVLAFPDIFPKAPVHLLLIPKGAYKDATDFFDQASADEMVAFNQAILTLVKQYGLDATGYRLIANTGANGGQEVPHFHMHILGGGPLGPMVLEK